MKKVISINYSETHYFKYRIEIDLDVFKKCSPPFEGEDFDDFKEYIWSYVYDGTDSISCNEEWFQNNESLLNQTKLSNGNTLYDELYIDGLQISDEEEDYFTEHQDLEEDYDSDHPG